MYILWWNCVVTIPVAARLLGLRVRIPPRTWTSVVSVACCQVEVSATGRSLVKRSPADCGVSEFDREALIMRRPWPSKGLLRHAKQRLWLFDELIDCAKFCFQSSLNEVTLYCLEYVGVLCL